MKRMLVLMATLGATPPAAAQQATPSPTVSVTVSPLHLLNPQLHVTGEWRLARRSSVAVSLGAGNVTDEDQTYRIGEVGAQWRYYVIGTFTHGLMVGADVGYVDVNGQMVNAMTYLVGTRAGGVIGYKKTTRRGFTAETQIGPVYVWGDDASEPQTVVNLKVGWSF